MPERIWLAYRGPSHVIIQHDPVLTTLLGYSPLGMPAREAFAQADHAPMQRAMDQVYRTGQPCAIATDNRMGLGVVVIVPLRDELGVWGIGTLWKGRTRAAAPLASVPSARPALRETA